MRGSGDAERDLAGLVVPQCGAVIATGDRLEPFRLVDGAGVVVGAVAEFFCDLQAAGRAEWTLRSYGLDLLRWFRFLWAVGVGWDRASRVEARDFCRWMRVAGKPPRAHWRSRGAGGKPEDPGREREPYSAAARAHAETVLRGFYDFHLGAGSGPLVNPFPLDRPGRGGRAHAHHNPMERYRDERAGRYRPVVPARIPRSVPDAEFNEIFARLPSQRDRALVAFYVSTGARASELLSAAQGGVHPGRQVIAVTRKGPGRVQELPASPDAFVVAAAVSGRDGGADPRRRFGAAVVDAAPPGPAAGLPRRAPDVRTGLRARGVIGDAARAAAHSGLPDGNEQSCI